MTAESFDLDVLLQKYPAPWRTEATEDGRTATLDANGHLIVDWSRGEFDIARLLAAAPGMMRAAQAIADEASAIDADVPGTRMYNIPSIGIAALRKSLP